MYAYCTSFRDLGSLQHVQQLLRGVRHQGRACGLQSRPAPEETLYVGDSEVDVATARNAGLPLAAVSWGFRGRRALAEAGAAVIVDAAAELLEVLR